MTCNRRRSRRNRVRGDLPAWSGPIVNFAGLNEDPARATFGDNYDRLAAVKATYDPENLFHLNRNVEPTA